MFRCFNCFPVVCLVDLQKIAIFQILNMVLHFPNKLTEEEQALVVGFDLVKLRDLCIPVLYKYISN